MVNDVSIQTLFGVTLSIILLFFYFFEQYRSKSALNIGSLIFLYGSLYISAPVFSISNSSLAIGWVFASFFSIILLYMSYCVFNKKSEESMTLDDCKVFWGSRPILFPLFLVLFIFSIAIAFYIIEVKVGAISYFMISRPARSLIHSQFSNLLFFRDLLNVVCVFSYFSYVVTKETKWKWLFFISFSLAIFYAIFTISRASLVQVLFPIIYIASYFRFIGPKFVNTTLFVGVFFAISWKWLLSSLIFRGELDFSTFTLELPGEFTAWYQIAKNTEGIYMLGGKSIIDAVASLFYPFWSTEALSTWYVRIYEPDFYAIGGGRGFSLLVEGYINWGVIGVIFIFSSIGLLFGYAERMAKRNVSYIYICAVTLPILHKIYRSELLSIFKTYWWYYIIPFIATLIIIKLLIGLRNTIRA